MARLVLADTSPLIGLSRIGGVFWLEVFFHRVEITPTVLQELKASDGPESEIREALASGWLATRPSTSANEPTPPHLGPGEWSTLQAAKHSSGASLILMDDRLARREARSLDLEVTGTAALIGMAQTRGLIDSARDIFARLIRSDFRISPAVLREVLARIDRD